ncbi:MAG: HAMP domain-containing histidine kinase [Gorillibacterium sp.]|nr:HAMP domain-containing histidine kinase [Gorillibacterium sp.]
MIFYVVIFIALGLAAVLLVMQQRLRKLTVTLQNMRLGDRSDRIRLVSSQPVLRELYEEIENVLLRLRQVQEQNVTNDLTRKQLISNMSHDLRTPLTSIMGYVEALESEASLSVEQRAAHLAIVSKKCRSLHRLLEDFFQLAKLEAGDDLLVIKKVNLSELIRQTFLLHYREISDLRLTPILDLTEHDIMAWADEDAVVRVLTNLLSNSLKYGGDGNEIGIHIHAEPDKVWVELWDNGRGIPHEQQADIFERLYTLEKSRNQHYQGTGIGLTIVKKLVELQGGAVSVQSDPFKKTIFSFSLPRAS